jgi:hypothetical protein
MEDMTVTGDNSPNNSHSWIIIQTIPNSTHRLKLIPQKLIK